MVDEYLIYWTFSDCVKKNSIEKRILRNETKNTYGLG